MTNSWLAKAGTHHLAGKTKQTLRRHDEPHTSRDTPCSVMNAQPTAGQVEAKWGSCGDERGDVARAAAGVRVVPVLMKAVVFWLVWQRPRGWVGKSWAEALLQTQWPAADAVVMR